MKKTIPLLALASLLFAASYAQDNKPIPNSFGIQYGVSYSGVLNQSLVFSGWLDKGIEIRGGTLLNVSQTDSKTGNSTSVSSIGGQQISAYNNSESKSGSIIITPNISVLKHFKTKSNIDPFVGGLISTAVNIQTIQSQNINETIADNYDRYTNSLSKTPVITTIGLSLVGGVNYFFVKNFSIGVDAGFGFTTAITNGKRYNTSITRNTGTNNPSSVNQESTSSSDYKVLTSTLNLSGNGGLRFTYYIPTIKTKKKSSDKI